MNKYEVYIVSLFSELIFSNPLRTKDILSQLNEHFCRSDPRPNRLIPLWLISHTIDKLKQNFLMSLVVFM